jgi:hypothetical protein
MNQHPFEQKLYSGKCDIHELRKWLIDRYYFEETMLKKDCVIIENSTDHSFRKVWIKRIIDSQSPLRAPRNNLLLIGEATLAYENYLFLNKSEAWPVHDLQHLDVDLLGMSEHR